MTPEPEDMFTMPRDPFFLNSAITDRWSICGREPVVPFRTRVARRLGLIPRPVPRDAHAEGVLLFEFDGEDAVLAAAAEGLEAGTYRRASFHMSRVIAPTPRAHAADPTLPVIAWDHDTIAGGWQDDEIDVVRSLFVARSQDALRGETLLGSLRALASTQEARSSGDFDAVMGMRDPIPPETIIAGMRAMASTHPDRSRYNGDIPPHGLACSAPTPWLPAMIGCAWGHRDDPWDRGWSMAPGDAHVCADLPPAMPPCLVARVQRPLRDGEDMTMIRLSPLMGCVPLDEAGIDPLVPIDPMETLRAIRRLHEEFPS
jgi:hypothetical protein